MPEDTHYLGVDLAATWLCQCASCQRVYREHLEKAADRMPFLTRMPTREELKNPTLTFTYQ